MLEIEGKFLRYKFCHKRKCERYSECLRNEHNMWYNWISVVMDGEGCDEKSGFPLFLSIPPKENEIKSDEIPGYYGDEEVEEDCAEEVTEVDYVEYINNLIKKSRKATIYLEPFVGNSKSIDKIVGIENKFGTDISPDKVKNIMEKCNGTSKGFRACDYKVWNKILLSDSYKGKCIIFCEPPRKDTENFKFDEFFDIAKKWAEFHKVIIRCERLPRRSPVLEINDKDKLYFL